MGADQHHDWRSIAASALEWWRDAGVELLVAEEPRDWLAPAAPAPVRAAPASPAGAAGPLPDTLTAFLAWRLGEAAPERAFGARLLAPFGNPDADLAIVADLPDPEDHSAGALLSGAPGRLFDRMLAAIGRDRSSVYCFGLALARPASGRIPPELEPRLGELARHLLSLTPARRVLLMGQTAGRAVLGTNDPRLRGRLHPVNHAGREWLAVAGYHPRFLLEKPACKADAWKDLQLLIGGNDPCA